MNPSLDPLLASERPTHSVSSSLREKESMNIVEISVIMFKGNVEITTASMDDGKIENKERLLTNWRMVQPEKSNQEDKYNCLREISNEENNEKKLDD